MSISIGTLRERRTRRSMWPVAFLAAVVVITAALVAFTLSQDGPRSAPPAGAPTEVSSGVQSEIVSGTAANTPTEIRFGYAARFVEQAGVAGTNTPTELSGGLNQVRGWHQQA